MNNKAVKKHAHFLGALLLLALTAVMMFLILRGTDIREIINDVKSVNPFWLTVSAIALVVYVILLAMGLHIPLCTICDKKVKFSDSIGYTMIGSYYSAITPSAVGGQPMQLYYMTDGGIPFSHASLALLVANIAYQAVVLILPAIMFIFKSKLIIENVHGFMWLLIFGVAVSFIIIAFILMAMFSNKLVEKVCHKLIGFLIKIRIVKNGEKLMAKANEQLESYKAGSNSMRCHKFLFVKVLAVYIFQMAALFSIPYFIYRAFGLSEFGFFDVLAIQSVLYIAVCFLPLPGAAGATESAFLSLFRVVFAEGLIVPAMLLSRVVSFYLLLIVSGIFTLYIQIRSAGRHSHTAVPETTADE